MEGGIKYRSVEFQKSRHESDTSYDLRTNRGRNPVRSANRRLSTGFRLSGEQSVDNHRRPTRSTIVDSRDEDGRRGEVAPGLSGIMRRPVLPRRDAASEIRVQVLVQAAVPRAKGRQRTVLGIRRK